MRNSSFWQYLQCHSPGMRAFPVMPFVEEYSRTARLASDPVGIHPRTLNHPEVIHQSTDQALAQNACLMSLSP